MTVYVPRAQTRLPLQNTFLSLLAYTALKVSKVRVLSNIQRCHCNSCNPREGLIYPQKAYSTNPGPNTLGISI